MQKIVILDKHYKIYLALYIFWQFTNFLNFQIIIIKNQKPKLIIALHF